MGRNLPSLQLPQHRVESYAHDLEWGNRAMMVDGFFSSEARQRLVEYTLMCAVVGLITVVAVRVIDEQIVRMFAQINNTILGNIGQG